MPSVFIEHGFRFHFYSSEGQPREPIHILVAKRGEGDAKLWLFPDVSIAYNRGVDVRTLRWLMQVAESRRLEIVDAWHEHFGTG